MSECPSKAWDRYCDEQEREGLCLCGVRHTEGSKRGAKCLKKMAAADKAEGDWYTEQMKAMPAIRAELDEIRALQAEVCAGPKPWD